MTHNLVKVCFRFRTYAVPVFMLISFLLTEKIFRTVTYERLKRRLYRILYPHIVWGVVYFITYNAISMFIKDGATVKISDLLWQIFTGHSEKLNVAMWFQINLFFLTLLFSLVATICKQYKFYVFYILIILSYLLQYLGINNRLFGNLRFELRYPLGRFFEMIPYAVAGYYMAAFDILKKIKENRFKYIIILFFTLRLIETADMFRKTEGFGYQGMEKSIVAICLVSIASLIPFEFVPDMIHKIIIVITRYTMGIYCMHFMIGRILTLIYRRIGIETGTFKFCVMIWGLCYLISHILYTGAGNSMKEIVN